MTKPSLAFLALVLTTAVAGAPLGAAAVPGPATIRRDIARSGAKAVVDRLYESHRYEAVVERIGDGSVPWILLAPALSGGTDAATSEELGEALVHALPRAPAAVLSVIDLGGASVPRSPATVCGAGFYEGDPTDPRRYRIAAIRAVEHVGAPRLMAARRACLAELRKS